MKCSRTLGEKHTRELRPLPMPTLTEYDLRKNPTSRCQLLQMQSYGFKLASLLMNLFNCRSDEKRWDAGSELWVRFIDFLGNLTLTINIGPFGDVSDQQRQCLSLFSSVAHTEPNVISNFLISSLERDWWDRKEMSSMAQCFRKTVERLLEIHKMLLRPLFLGYQTER
ncbi:hypothetical protein BJ508DRAFT_378768 [Ascobolus immersus RN42]|uniref:Uncharacterized protein n=1 Tax=Ascobolus immersus RN42 TaxID=1160509 RepID=A0A3N4I083_ASCIM|nr:hypothetical protein BJ508DRAFT_378768 [Ascobolus immersus RN42]